MESIGDTLRRERLSRDVSLEELARVTRIPVRNLVLIEEDRANELPAPTYARGFVRSYCAAIGLPADDLVARMGRRPPPRTPVVGTALVRGEAKPRVGLAVAVLVLMILFTLALTALLRPRPRTDAFELAGIGDTTKEDLPCAFS
jgi:cytoskeletal protein RodZ